MTNPEATSSAANSEVAGKGKGRRYRVPCRRTEGRSTARTSGYGVAASRTPPNCVVRWGTRIGSNEWNDADVVILCDEFFIPRRTAAANVQGLREHQVHEGDLATMTTPTNSAPGVDLYQLGNRLRWTKQMALRGRARCYDEHGVCGKMLLVVACELENFMANVSRLFPGANVRLAGDCTKGTWAERVIRLLNGSEALSVSTSELGNVLRREWRKISRDVLTPEFLAALDGMGWRYVSGKGRGGSWFEWIEANEALAA
jgi:hypothetical protein